MSLVLRRNLTRALTWDELDHNLEVLEIDYWVPKSYDRLQKVMVKSGNYTYIYNCVTAHNKEVYEPDNVFITTNDCCILWEIIASTYNGLPPDDDIHVTGMTYNSSISGNTLTVHQTQGFPDVKVFLPSYASYDHYTYDLQLSGTTLVAKRTGALPNLLVDLQSLVDISTGVTHTDYYVTGASMSGTVLRLTRNDGVTVTVNLATLQDGNYYTTGATLSGTTVTFRKNFGLPYYLDLSALLTGATGGGSVIINQTGHSFNVMEVVRATTVENVFARAKADDEFNADVAGVVSRVLSPNSFVLTIDGEIQSTEAPNFPIGTYMFLSPTSDGTLIDYEPTNVGEISVPVGIVLKPKERFLVIHNRGSEILPPFTGGTSGYSGYSGLGSSGYSGYSGMGGSGYSGYSGKSGYSGYSGISGYSGYSGTGGSGASGYSGYSGLGESGYSGYSGTAGSTSGYSGYSGYNGESGYSGYSGSGASGYSGYSGSGVSGYSGYSGAVGTGTSGYSGYSGLDGVATGSGYSGYSGYSGESNVSGYSGYSGISGYSGYSGISGYSGYSGISGYSGYSGSGDSGYSGYSGISGYSGYSGISGSGVSGYSGYSGISGYSGYSGISGYSGYSGISGYSGYSGISGYSGYSGSGASGYSGYSGEASAASSGYSGYSGSGSSGYSGYSGSGTSGYSGYSGSGASGYSGYSGISGYSGYSGISGYSGYSGYSGQAGNSGFITDPTFFMDTSSDIVYIQNVTVGSGTSGVFKYRDGGQTSGYFLQAQDTDGTAKWVSGTIGSGTSGYSGYSGVGGATSGYSGYSGYSGISGYSGYSGVAPSLTINNNADNRVLTANGSSTSIEAESGFTYNAGYLTEGHNGLNTFEIQGYGTGSTSVGPVTTAAPALVSLRSRGTPSSKTAVLLNDKIFEQHMFASYGTGVTTNRAVVASIIVKAKENYNTSNPLCKTELVIATNNTSPTVDTLDERVIIDTGGTVNVPFGFKAGNAITFSTVAFFTGDTTLDKGFAYIADVPNATAVNFTLPSAATCVGRLYYIAVNTLGGGGTLVIRRNGSDSIGWTAGNVTISATHKFILLQSDGVSNWLPISNGL